MATVAPKLKYSIEYEPYGWVQSTPTFDNDDDTFKLDLICDWISGLLLIVHYYDFLTIHN